jgi:hypothetical protein
MGGGGQFTLLGGQNYFSGGQILLGVKNTSMGGQKKFDLNALIIAHIEYLSI